MNKNLILNSNQNKILAGLFIFSLIFLFYLLSSFIWIVGASLVLYIVCRPLNDFLNNYIQSRALCILIISVSVLAFIIIPLMFILVALANQTIQLFQYLQGLIDSGYFQNLQLNAKVLKLFYIIDIDPQAILNDIISHVQQMFMMTIPIVSRLIMFPIMLIVNTIGIMLIFVFFLSEGKNLGNIILKILPFEASLGEEIYAKIDQAVKTLMFGNLIVMALHGVVVGVCFWAFGIRAPLLWGSIAGLVSIIPIVGTTIIWIPAGLYFLFKEAYLSAVILSLVCLIGYQICESFLKPYLIGEKLKLNSIMIFFLILGSLGTFGVAGVIVGPLVLVIVYTLYDIYVKIKYSENKNIGKKTIKVRKK